MVCVMLYNMYGNRAMTQFKNSCQIEGYTIIYNASIGRKGRCIYIIA